MTLITIPQAAQRLSLSKATVYRMIQARDYRACILMGQITESDVPHGIRPYLHAGFPAPSRLTPRTTRIDQSALEHWAKGRTT